MTARWKLRGLSIFGTSCWKLEFREVVGLTPLRFVWTSLGSNRVHAKKKIISWLFAYWDDHVKIVFLTFWTCGALLDTLTDYVVMRFDESVPLSGMMFLLSLGVHLKSVYVLRSLFLLLVEVFLPLLWLPGVYTEAFAICADSP